ncbi:hypothetical protein DsansV1_C08g0086191 [Dioscorea sansibarensis]
MHQAPQNPYPYYGPPIPLQQANYQNKPRSCFCCLFSTIIKAFIAFCIVIGITILILWLVYRPQKIKVSVENAYLTNFTLTSSPSYLDYNLSTTVSVRNPNKRIGIYYDMLGADVNYSGNWLGSTTLPTFYQGHKNTTMVFPSFDGRTTVIASSALDAFKNENATRFFNMNMWFYARVRYKYGSLTTRRYTVRIRCYIRVPLVTNGSSNNTGFQWTKCDVDY